MQIFNNKTRPIKAAIKAAYIKWHACKITNWIKSTAAIPALGHIGINVASKHIITLNVIAVYILIDRLQFINIMYQHSIGYIFTVTAQILHSSSSQNSTAFSTGASRIIADRMSARRIITNIYCSLIRNFIAYCHFIISTQSNIAITA